MTGYNSFADRFDDFNLLVTKSCKEEKGRSYYAYVKTLAVKTRRGYAGLSYYPSHEIIFVLTPIQKWYASLFCHKANAIITTKQFR
jgi:hypothetical protein